MGVTEFTEILYDHRTLLHEVDLPGLDDPFTLKGINAVLNEIPPDHTPDTNGLNDVFFKKCWHIIKDDIIRLCADFVAGTLDLQSINNSSITLVPKIPTRTTVNDLHAISMLNLSFKFPTKLLANRLQQVILQVVHDNQYGFIKGQIIKDCLAWAFQFLHICHKSKKEIVILKLDFEKTFDEIEHKLILEVLRHKEFSDKRITSIECILGSATSPILLNGVPGKHFKCLRGAQQEDPLSLLLFVLGADLLQSVNNDAANRNILEHLLGSSFGGDYPIIQYADDTLIILPVDAPQLTSLKGILATFAASTGLKVNYNISFVVPINVDQHKLQDLAAILGSQIGQMPFTYLGIPLGTTRPSITDFLPILTRMVKYLMGITRLLSYAGRLTLVNSVYSAIPFFYMCTLKLPPTIIDQIDKYTGKMVCEMVEIYLKREDV